MSFFENIGKTISDASQGVVQKGKEMADVARYNLAINEEEKKMASIYEQIGRKYVEDFKEVPSDQFLELINMLNSSKRKISDYQQKLNEVKFVSRCSLCGAENTNDAIFCAVCGAKVIDVSESEKDEKHCASCGAIISEGSKFCASCGQQVVD